MAWNEPGGGNKDPWSGKGGDQGPPDLDEVIKKLQDKLGGIFGGGKPPRGGTTEARGPSPALLGLIVAVIIVGWMLYGFYKIEAAQRGIVLIFGKYSETTQPGLNWNWPSPIGRVLKVNVDQISSFRHEATMLTRDENIVVVELTVQSRIQDPTDYMFQDQDPEKTIRDAIETSVREVIGKSDLDFILTEGRSAIADRIKSTAQGLIDSYKTGLIITSVNTQPAKPPEAVKSAFDDAIKAREDKERLENKAEAYANEVIPQARGEAARQVADAKAYKDRVIAEAQGESSRFLSILKEYQQAPKVTRERLYLDAVETVLGQSSKVLLDTEAGNSLMYLPLDKLIQQGDDESSPPVIPSAASSSAASPMPVRPRPRENTRSRSVR